MIKIEYHRKYYFKPFFYLNFKDIGAGLANFKNRSINVK